MPQPPDPNQNIEQLDTLCTNLVGAATLFERHKNKLDGNAVEDYIRQIREAASKQVSEARKEQVMQDFNSFLVNVDMDEKEIIDWRNNMLEEIEQTPPTPNGDEQGGLEKLSDE